MKNILNPVIVLAITVLAITSCKDEELSPQEQFNKDQKTIEAYLDENGIVAQQDSDYGLYYVMHNPGSGDRPQQADQIVTSYDGRILKTGETLDARDSITFVLGDLIAGWRILIPLLEEGGSMTMYLPRGFAYGDDNLIFDMTLHDVK